MAFNSINTDIKTDSDSSPDLAPPPKFRLVIPLVVRRGAAALVEVSLVAVAAVVPFSLGQWANQQFKERVPLNPALVQAQEAIGKTLALPRYPQPQPVAPLTNLLWSGALIFPLLLGGWQLLLLARTGQTSPKRWFALAVVTIDGSPPGISKIFLREGVGRWGLPLTITYLLWRYTGAFPNVSILLTLAGLLVVLESTTTLLNSRRRSFHDQLANTYVVDVVWLEEQPESIVSPEKTEFNGFNGSTVPSVSPGATPNLTGSNSQQITYINGKVVVEQLGEQLEDEAIAKEQFPKQFPNYFPENFSHASPDPQEELGARVTTITLQPRLTSFNLWGVMRRYPGITLLTALLGSIFLILGTFVGTQIYIQGQTNQRNLKQQQNEIFLALVRQLNTATSAEERKGVILALGRIEDTRVVPFLVDLLSREKTPNSMETIEQALIANGLASLPSLQKLNQALQNDLQTAVRRAQKEEQDLVLARQKAVARSIVKILTIYAKAPQTIDLTKVDFSAIPAVLEGLDLAGVKFSDANLFNANLRYSNFFNPGEDGIYDTYDDIITDLTRANLQQVDFTGSILIRAIMNESNLSWSAINKADFTNSSLVRANLSGSQIINSKFIQANLEQASLTGTNLGDSQFIKANLTQANFGKTKAINTNFSLTSLTKTNWQLADASQANFQGANLQDADLSNGKFVGAKFTNANLVNVNLRASDLRFADLRGASLAGANFQGVVFFTAPSNTPDQFIKAVIPREGSTIVKQVDFSQVRNLDRQQLEYICTQGGIHPKCL